MFLRIQDKPTMYKPWRWSFLKGKTGVAASGFNDLISVTQAAKQMSCRRSTIYRMIDESKLEAINPGKRLTRIRRRTLKHY